MKFSKEIVGGLLAAAVSSNVGEFPEKPETGHHGRVVHKTVEGKDKNSVDGKVGEAHIREGESVSIGPEKKRYVSPIERIKRVFGDMTILYEQDRGDKSIDNFVHSSLGGGDSVLYEGPKRVGLYIAQNRSVPWQEESFFLVDHPLTISENSSGSFNISINVSFLSQSFLGDAPELFGDDADMYILHFKQVYDTLKEDEALIALGSSLQSGGVSSVTPQQKTMILGAVTKKNEALRQLQKEVLSFEMFTSDELKIFQAFLGRCIESNEAIRRSL